jgi:DsbC/DsbD-like thiol-disulfide interchange protein
MSLWLAIALLAVPQEAAPKSVETAHLRVATSTSTVTAAAAKRLSLYVDVTPKPDMHVYSPGQEGYIAVTLTLDAGGPVAAAGKAKFPAGEKYFMPALNETQLVYSKPFRIAQDVTIKPGAPAGPVTLKGSLRYQACDDKICYLPKTIPLEWTVTLAPR